MLSKKRTVVLLRWLLIVASSYMMILGPRMDLVPPGIGLLVVIALASNLAVSRLPESWVEAPGFDLCVAIFDAAWITLGLTWGPGTSGDLFLLYFLVIFIAAVGQSLLNIVGSAVVVSVVYGAMLGLQTASVSTWEAGTLLRVPFLFVVALFYGYFVTEIRGRRSEADHARSREQAKTELLAAVSHDLRGPVGNAEAMLEMVLDDLREGRSPAEDLLLGARVNMRRVTSLVSNLLEAACLEAGQMAFDLRRVQVNDIVGDVCAVEGSAARLGGVMVRTELATNLPAVLTDAVQLDRILTNLVNNAVKHSAAGGIVTVRTSLDEQRFAVEVQDEGPGLTAQQQGELFSPYRRLHLEGYTQGKGLGLYIVKALTEGLGGEVTVVSEPGIGSTFRVSFPAACPGGNKATAAVREPNVPVAFGTMPQVGTAAL